MSWVVGLCTRLLCCMVGMSEWPWCSSDKVPPPLSGSLSATLCGSVAVGVAAVGFGVGIVEQVSTITSVWTWMECQKTLY